MSKHKIKYTSNYIYIKNHKIELPYPVRQIVEIDNLFVIRVEPPINQNFNRNIYCFSNEPELIWVIEEDKFDGEENPYVSIFVEDGKLIAGCWKGMDYIVSLETGQISPYKFTK